MRNQSLPAISACDADEHCQHCLLMHPVTQTVLTGEQGEQAALHNHRLRERIFLKRGERLYARGCPSPHIARLVKGALRLEYAAQPDSLAGVLFAPAFLGPMNSASSDADINVNASASASARTSESANANVTTNINAPTNQRGEFIATALSEVELCCFAHETLHRLFAAHPHLQGRFLEHALGELTAMHREAALLHKSRARSRIAALLWMLLRDAPNGEAVLPLRRSDMAALLHTTPETVSRVLSALRRDRIIQIGARNYFKARNLHALRALIDEVD